MQDKANTSHRKLNGTFQRTILHPDPLFADEGCSNTIVNRFWRHVVKTNWCWPWTGVVDGDSATGIISKGGRSSGNIKARKVSWLIHFGVPATRRIWLTCGNPVCVNPEHFKIGYGAPLPPLLSTPIQPCADDELDYADQDPTLPEGFSKSFITRFNIKLDRAGGPNACWPWRGCRNTDGYGQIGRGRNQKSNVIGAHRASWIVFRGPIPDGLEVLHDCPGGDNPSCCNPKHLWLGTKRENLDDAISKSELRGKIHWRSKLSPNDRENIQKDFLNGDYKAIADLGRKYKTGAGNIHRILNQIPKPSYFAVSVSGAVSTSTRTGNNNCITTYVSR